MKYGKCWKCGAIQETEDEFSMCTAPMIVRTSGICGGSFDEISKEVYDKLYKEYKQS